MVRHNPCKCQNVISDSRVVTAIVVAAANAFAVYATAVSRRANRSALACAVDTLHRSFDRSKLGPHVSSARIGARNPISDTHYKIRIRLDSEQAHSNETLAQLLRQAIDDERRNVGAEGVADENEACLFPVGEKM